MNNKDDKYIEELFHLIKSKNSLNELDIIKSTKPIIGIIFNIIKKIIKKAIMPIIKPAIFRQAEINSYFIQIINHFISSKNISHKNIELYLYDFPDIGEKKLTVAIDTTGRCNLRCIMCYSVLHNGEMVNEDFTLDEFKKIAEELFPITKELRLSCATEPFMNKQFSLFLKETARYNIPFTMYVTNGLMMTEPMIDATIDAKINYVNISIDGASKKTYESIRINSNFEKVIRNIKLLKAKKKSLNLDYPIIGLTYVLMKRNITEVPAFIELAKEIGADELHFCHMIPYKGLNTLHESLYNYKEEANLIIDTIIEKCKQLKIKLGTCPEKFELGRSSIILDNYEKRNNCNPAESCRKFCDFPWRYVVILSNGNILPCAYGWKYGPMGNIKKESFLNIWNNINYIKLRYQMLTNNLPECCNLCSASVLKGNIDDALGFKEH